MFRHELQWLLGLFGETPGIDGKALVLSHTDLLCGNVIIQDGEAAENEQKNVSFIDYEYATAAPPAFDVANSFAEWMGPELEHRWMPSRSQRMEFIEEYIRNFREHVQPSESTNVRMSDEDAVEQLYLQVQDFRGLTGFYWCVSPFAHHAIQTDETGAFGA